MTKNNKTARPIGAERLHNINTLGGSLGQHIRAAEGLTSALLAIYSRKLEDAEEQLQHLGRQPSDDVGVAYSQKMFRTQELRGLVAIVTAATKELEGAGAISERIEALTRNLGGAK